ncbi:MAG: phytanoyl-CoA dioxygenase [Gemmatimonadetes bacterium]|nr:phytanoyl-CoA dioxygenase [Gemmatimonadota bacterium]MBT6147496.1 phytanoyl-CoA dioxygenase [Gemmatimonadota bacterium]MBT7861840.1 phytanoyl-CoA dioxygenase [Gemmatimonadota bacterium]
MTTLTDAGLTYSGDSLETDADSLGELRRSDDIAHDAEGLQERMAQDGYLFLPGLLDRSQVMDARKEVLRRLASQGIVDDVDHELMDGIVREDASVSFAPDLARDNAELTRVVYDGPMMDFYERFLGGPVRHFDYTWFRAKTPGTTTATQPHYDVVYMGRGTKNLWTSWTPLGDVPLDSGGLIVLEGSHKNEALRDGYGTTDVDKFCANENEAAVTVGRAQDEGRELTSQERQTIHWQGRGSFSGDAVATRAELGGRWLTSTFEAGDLLVLSIFMMHASTDNLSSSIRLSADTRYQLASDPVDERWIGDDPPLHTIRAKRGLIC